MIKDNFRRGREKGGKRKMKRRTINSTKKKIVYKNRKIESKK